MRDTHTRPKFMCRARRLALQKQHYMSLVSSTRHFPLGHCPSRHSPPSPIGLRSAVSNGLCAAKTNESTIRCLTVTMGLEASSEFATVPPSSLLDTHWALTGRSLDATVDTTVDTAKTLPGVAFCIWGVKRHFSSKKKLLIRKHRKSCPRYHFRSVHCSVHCSVQ